MAIEKLVIEISGNASGLTKALAQAQKNLTLFNTNIAAGNKALNTFVASMNKGVAAANRLNTTINQIKTNFTGLSRNIITTANAVERLGNSAKAANSDIKAFSSSLNRVATSFERISGASKSATAAINSLQRRVAALGTTVSAVNSNMRTFNRTIEMGTAGAARGGIVVNNFSRSVEGAGRSADRSAGLFNRLNKANITLLEGFRRHVAQITALRTLVYQGIFWFSPLIYSIIKVNAQYERQMQLLKNLSGQTSEMAKTQWALQTRKQLVELANTNPFSLNQITNSFVRMKVSGLDPLNGSLQTLMDSIAAFGGGNDELERAGIALQQMVGKSAVSMEELRQQLGEHIPDAMKAMAQGMGLSMADFYKAVQKGTVEAKSAIHNMLVVLNQDHRGAAVNMMNTWNGMLARLGTAWQNFVANLEHHPGRNTFIDELKNRVQELMVFLNSPAGVNFAISVEQALATVARAIGNVIRFVYEWRTQIVEAAKIFAIMWGGKLVLGTLISVIRVFGGGLRTIITVINAFTTASAGAALITGRLAQVVRSLAVALGIAASAGQAAAMSIGFIAARMAGAVGIAIALAAAVWLVVKALNAQTNAQKNAKLAKEAAEGRTWDDEDPKNNYNSRERNAERARLENIKRQANLSRTGGYTTNAEGEAIYFPKNIARANKLDSEYTAGAHAFNLKNANTRNARQVAINTQFEGTQPDPYAKTKAHYDDLLSKLNPSDKQSGPQAKTLREQKGKQLQQDAFNDIQRLQGMKKNASPQDKIAIDQLIDRRLADLDSYKDPFVPQEYIQSKKAGKKKKGGGEKRDPLQKYRDKYASAFVSTADLEHQYSDLVNGTSTEFDAESAQIEGDRRASLLKTAEALKIAAANEKSRQEEVRKSIKVEQAIHDIEDKRADAQARFGEELDNLKINYQSITLETKHYQESLEREYRAELQIAEARMATGKATEDEIRQYVQLKDAIDNAIRSKQAELVVEAAKDAKASNEDYYATFRSAGQQASYQGGLDYARYSDALKNAIQLAKNQRVADEDLAAAKAELAAATAKHEAATDEATKAETDAIIVSAKRTIQMDEESRAAAQSIPYLQERLRILEQEEAARQKWHGAGGPLFDWAKTAASDFNNLGESMGNVLTGAMDNFISSLADGKMAFKDFAKTVLKQLLMIIIRGLIAKAILSALGLASNGSSSGGIPFDASGGGNLFTFDTGHTGMIVGGRPGGSTQVDPALFSFAKRYHTGGIAGLGANEVPIIAERGEGIFTQEQMKALGQSKKGSNVQVNVINQTGVEADVHKEEPKFDGEKWVETIILKKMGQPGPVRNALVGMTKR
jgi:lambda family phage tail tape measure protein